jgi:DNA-binding beta-propeller fold protein YncE
MFRKIIAGAAVAGALTFGLAGVAGAATTSTGSTGSAVITPSTTVCSLLPQFQAHVQKVETRLAAELPKARAAEAKDKAAGDTVRADRIANRITKIQDRENKVNTRLAKLSTDCSTKG